MLVVDASAIVDLLLAAPAAEQVAQRLLEHPGDLHVPHLLDVELLHALRRVVLRQPGSAGRVDAALEAFLELPLTRYGHALLAPRIWALRANFSAYDAAYLALAEALVPGGAPLLTADLRFARAVAAHAQVEVLLADAGAC